MFSFLKRSTQYPVGTGRRIEGPPTSGEGISISLEEELKIIRKALKIRPGDRLPDDLKNELPRNKYAFNIGGYFSFGPNWPGPEIVTSSDYVVEKITFGIPKIYCMIDGMKFGMASLDFLRLYPGATISFERETEIGSGKFHRKYETTFRDRWRIIATELDGKMEVFHLMRIGYSDEREEIIQARRAAREREAAEARDRELQLSTERDGPRIVDPVSDAMLTQWGTENSATSQELVNRLLSSQIAEWTQILDNINWDFGLEPLFWIVRQPQAHPETLFEIFVLSEPSYFCDPANQSPDFVNPEFKLITEIRDRMAGGFYTSAAPFDGISAWDSRLSYFDAEISRPWRKLFRRRFP